jgi:hypothetical protein
MLTFTHIPTGTTVNKAIHVDASKGRGVAPATAPTIIGADIETEPPRAGARRDQDQIVEIHEF